MIIREYLKRIDYIGKIEVNLKVLSTLQKQHLLNIPFENFDIHLNNKITLDWDNIYDKIVNNKRGGFCYELNGLFYYLLHAIGFETKMISGRVYNKEKEYGKEYDHLALIVNLEGEDYLVDAGFGEFVFYPLKLALEIVQEDERGMFQIDKYDDEYFRVNKLVDEMWTPQYIFKEKKREYHEFTEMSYYHQNNSASHFTHKKFIGIPITNGRITIVGDKLKIIRHETIEERTVEDNEVNDLLIEYFNFEETPFL